MARAYLAMFHANSIRLRACRKRAGFDQAELANLVGRNVHSFINIENGRFLPDTQSLIAYETLFDIPASSLLPDTRANVRRVTYERAQRLLKRCESNLSGHTRTKVEFLEALCRRLDGSNV